MSEIRTARPHRLRTVGWVAVAGLAAVAVAHGSAVVRALGQERPDEDDAVALDSSFGLGAFTGGDAATSAVDLARLAALATFIIWLYLARDNFGRRSDDNVNWRKGWTVGGWFVPLGNLVIPHQVVKEVYARSSPDRTYTPTRIVSAWWLLLILSFLTYTETFTMADDTTVVHTPPVIAVTGGAAGILAAALGAVLVRRVSSWQDAIEG